ncbi:hypothetical protein TNCV_4768341 [Trichonephila clavipes]|nr:hypothetical protein TNCV_4768341 [Trichonephila clavipes]
MVRSGTRCLYCRAVGSSLAATEDLVERLMHVKSVDFEVFQAPANLIGVLWDSDEMTAGACAVDLGYYTRAKASQSAVC